MSHILRDHCIFSACETGESIKPGALAPGSIDQEFRSPRMRATAQGGTMRGRGNMPYLSPIFMGSRSNLPTSLGLTPQALCFRLLSSYRIPRNEIPISPDCDARRII